MLWTFSTPFYQNRHFLTMAGNISDPVRKISSPNRKDSPESTLIRPNIAFRDLKLHKSTFHAVSLNISSFHPEDRIVWRQKDSSLVFPRCHPTSPYLTSTDGGQTKLFDQVSCNLMGHPNVHSYNIMTQVIARSTPERSVAHRTSVDSRTPCGARAKAPERRE